MGKVLKEHVKIEHTAAKLSFTMSYHAPLKLNISVECSFPLRVLILLPNGPLPALPEVGYSDP